MAAVYFCQNWDMGTGKFHAKNKKPQCSTFFDHFFAEGETFDQWSFSDQNDLQDHLKWSEIDCRKAILAFRKPPKKRRRRF